MKKLLLAAVMVWAPLAGCDVNTDDEKAFGEFNVNSRYLVESVQVSGQKNWPLSDSLRTELSRVVGSRLDHPALDALAERIKKELHVKDVSVKVVKGTTPDHVIVNFDITKAHEQPIELNVPKFLYASNEGWSAEGHASTTVKGNTFTFGLVSDSDELIERFSGLRVKFERKHLGTDRLRLRFEFDSFHELWNNATLTAASHGSNEETGIYRSRQVFAPEVTLVIAAPLELDFGASISRFEPEQPGAKTESSNAVVSTLRYHQRWGSAHDPQEQELNGNYSLRAGANIFGTDANFTRHKGELRYRFRHDRSTMEVAFLAGLITGNAPLFERFVLGNATTLRGWNKFELDPLGGSHVVHGSVEYSYRWLEAFYDAGAIWDRPQDREAKQSIGVGVKAEGFQLAVAFPMRSGHMEPVFYAGLNF